MIVLSNTGTILLKCAVGNLQPLASFQLVALNGVIRLAANVTATDGATGNVDFTAPLIQLEANVVIDTDGAVADKQVTFQGAVNADNATTQDRTLTVSAGTAGVGVFGTIGNLQPLADLDVLAGLFATNGNIVVNDGPAENVTFSGDLGFDFTNLATITTNGANDHGLLIGGRLYGDSGGQDVAVVIDAGTATVQLGSVGVGTIPPPPPPPPVPDPLIGAALADLDITAGLIRILGNVVIDDQGGNTASFNGPVELAADVSFDLDAASGADNSVLFGGTVASDATARDLTLAAGTGSVTFAAAVGTAPGHLDQFGVSSAALVDFDSTVRANDVSLDATTVRLANNVTALVDDLLIFGSAVLDGNVILTSGGAAGDTVAISGTTNADAAASNRTLTAAAGLGNVLLASAVGGTQPLAVVTVSCFELAAGAIGLTAGGALSVTNTGPLGSIGGAITGANATLTKAGTGTLG